MSHLTSGEHQGYRGLRLDDLERDDAPGAGVTCPSQREHRPRLVRAREAQRAGVVAAVVAFRLFACFLVGAAVRTPAGRAVRERLEVVFFERLPGYGLLRGLTQRLAGNSGENVWQPALAEFDDGLVPAFIIEELDDGRFTAFVPWVPTPLAGAAYMLAPVYCRSTTTSFSFDVRAGNNLRAGDVDSRGATGGMPGQRGENC